HESPLQPVVTGFIPLRLKLAAHLVQHALANALFHAPESWRERLHSRDSQIDAVARVEPAQRRVREIPFSRVEAEPLVDHYRAVRGPRRLAEEKRLSPVCVASPLVEYQH